MSEDVRSGQLLGGRYRVVRELGRGGMGAVFEAVQEGLGRRVALKVLLGELASEEMYLERFRREAEAAASLQHPNIVQVTDFSPRDPTFLVMELLEGTSLLDLLRSEGRLPVGRACAIMVHVLAALGAAHDAGIVHRDLKPANVFLVPLPTGEMAKLLDFGVAKLKESDGYKRLTATGSLVGTARYAAPEQLRAETVDARTDIFAAGVLLYGMIAGRPPFDGSGARLMVQICDDEPPDLRSFVVGVHGDLAAAIGQALAKDPDERFGSASDMAAALAPFATGIPHNPLAHSKRLEATLIEPRGPAADPRTKATVPARPAAVSSPDPTRPARPAPERKPAKRPPPRAQNDPPTPVPFPAGFPSPKPRRPSRMLLLWLGLGLGVIPLAAGVIGLVGWLLLRPRETATPPPAVPVVAAPSPPATPAEAPAVGTLPYECIEYERAACSCPGGERSRPCLSARVHNAERTSHLTTHPGWANQFASRCRRLEGIVAHCSDRSIE